MAVSETELKDSLAIAPTDTRAHVRSLLLRGLAGRNQSYFVDWETIDAGGAAPLFLMNPFDAKEARARAWLEELGAGPDSEDNK